MIARPAGVAARRPEMRDTARAVALAAAVALGIAASSPLPALADESWNPFRERDQAARDRKQANPAQADRPMLAPMGGVIPGQTHTASGQLAFTKRNGDDHEPFDHEGADSFASALARLRSRPHRSRADRREDAGPTGRERAL